MNDLVQKELEVSIGALPFGESRRTIRVPSGQTVEVILGDVPPHEHHDIIVISEDRVIECEEWHEVVPNCDYPLYVNVVPHGDFIPIIAVVGLAIAAPFAGGALAGALGFGAVGAAVLTGVISVLGGLLINSLFGQSFSGAARDPQRFSVQGTQNTLPNSTTPVLCVMGTHRVVPYFACKPYSYVIDKTTKGFRALYDFGYGPLDFDTDTFKFGESSTDSFDNVVIKTFDGSGTSDSAIADFPVVHDQVQLNKELVGYEENIIEYGAGVTQVDIAIEYPALVTFSKKGRKRPTSVFIQFDLKKSGENAFTTVETVEHSGESTSQQFFSTSITTAADADTAMGGQIRVYRTTATADESRKTNKSTITTVDKITTVPPVRVAGRALAFVQVVADQELQGTLQSFSAVVTRRIPTYNTNNGRWRTPRAGGASNPAWQFASVLRGPGIRTDASGNSKVKDTEIDGAMLAAFATRCNDRGYRFDGVFNGATGVWDRLVQLCVVGRASPNLIDGRLYSVIMDRKQTVPVDLLTPRDALSFSGTKEWEPRPDAFRVSFNDRDNSYMDTQVIVYDDGVTDATAKDVRALQLSSYGVTHVDEVHKLVRYMLAEARFRPESFSVVQDVKQLRIARGDYVDLAHDIPLLGLGYGRVTSVSGSTFILDENVALTGGGPWSARFQNLDGSALSGGVRAVTSTADNPSGDVLLNGGGTAGDATLAVDGAGASELITGLRFTLGSDTTIYTITAVNADQDEITISPVLAADAADDTALTFSAAVVDGAYVFLGSGTPVVGTVCALGVTSTEKLECLVRGIRAFDDLSAEITLVPLANEIHDAEDGDVPEYTTVISTGTGIDFGEGRPRTETSRVDNGNGTITITYDDNTTETLPISEITATGGDEFAFYRRTIADGTSVVEAIRNKRNEVIEWKRGSLVVARATFTWSLNESNQVIVENQVLSSGVSVSEAGSLTDNPREYILVYMDVYVTSTAEYDSNIVAPNVSEHEEVRNRVTQLMGELVNLSSSFDVFKALFPVPGSGDGNFVMVVGENVYGAARLESGYSGVNSGTDAPVHGGTARAGSPSHAHAAGTLHAVLPRVETVPGPTRVYGRKLGQVIVVTMATEPFTVNQGSEVEIVIERVVQAFTPVDISISYAVAGTAVAGTDYTALPGTVAMADDDDRVVIPVVIASDATAGRTLIVTLQTGVNYDITSPTTTSLTIAEAVPAQIRFAESMSTVNAGSTAQLMIDIVPGVPPRPLTIGYTVGGTGISGTDYSALTGSVSVDEDDTSVSIPVPVLEDATTDRTIILTLDDGTGYTVASAANEHTITVALMKLTLPLDVSDSLALASSEQVYAVDIPMGTWLYLITEITNFGSLSTNSNYDVDFFDSSDALVFGWNQRLLRNRADARFLATSAIAKIVVDDPSDASTSFRMRLNEVSAIASSLPFDQSGVLYADSILDYDQAIMSGTEVSVEMGITNLADLPGGLKRYRVDFLDSSGARVGSTSRVSSGATVTQTVTLTGACTTLRIDGSSATDGMQFRVRVSETPAS